MSFNLYFFCSLICQIIGLSQTMKLLPLNDEICLEILKLTGEDISNVEVLHNKLDPKSTYYSGQSPDGGTLRLSIAYERNFQMRLKTVLFTAPMASTLFNTLSGAGIFEKEYQIYSQILPEMRKLHDEGFTATFYTGNDAIFIHQMVLEDIYALGYTTPNRLKSLDLDHCKLVLEYLAKFHALSVKLDKLGLLPNRIKNNNKLEVEYDKIITNDEGAEENDYMAEERARYRDIAKSYNAKAMGKFIDALDPSLREKYSEKLQPLKEDIASIIAEESDNSCFKALIHGNFWFDNISFKYNKEMPKKLKILNFKAARWDCAVFDLIYFFITSTKFEHFEEHFDELLDVYSNTLNKMLQSFDIDDVAYEKKDIKNDFYKKYRFAVWVCGMILPLVDDPIGRVESIVHTCQKQDREDLPLMIENLYDSEIYKTKLSQWFGYFVQKGVFDD